VRRDLCPHRRARRSKALPVAALHPAEIGEEARRAYEAGAAVVHIHARNDDGSPTFSPAVFERIRAEVRARSRSCSTSRPERLARMFRSNRVHHQESPEIAALNMGT